MKKIFFLVFYFSLSCATAQVTFQKVYGSPVHDVTFKLAKTFDGGYAVAGLTEVLGNTDIFIFGTDHTGMHLWSVIYDGPGVDYATNIIRTSDNGFLIAGATSTYGSGGEDALLMKTNSGGGPVWAKVYGGPQQDHFLAAAQTGDGGFIAVGTTQSFGAGSNDIFIVRTNTTGDTLWTRIMGGASLDEVTAVIQTADGGFAVCGRSSSFTAANTDAVLLKLDMNGTITWSIQFGNFGAEEAHAVRQTSDGGYIVFGNATSFGNDYEPYLNRFTGSGNLVWSKLYSGPKSDAIYEGIITSDSGYAMCGFTESFGEGHRGTDSANFYLIRTDMNGDTLWTHTYGGDKVDEAFGLAEADDGGFAVLGLSRSFGTDSIEAYLVKTNSQGLSGCHEEPSAPQVITPTTIVSSPPFLVTSGALVAPASYVGLNPATHENILCLLDGMNDTEMNKDELVIFPNPFTNRATIKFNKAISEGILYLYNTYGQVVLQKNINGKEIVIDAENIDSGVYVAELFEKGKKIYSAKAIIY